VETVKKRGQNRALFPPISPHFSPSGSKHNQSSEERCFFQYLFRQLKILAELSNYT